MIAQTSSGRERNGEWLDSTPQITYVEGSWRQATALSCCRNAPLRCATSAGSARSATSGAQST